MNKGDIFKVEYREGQTFIVDEANDLNVFSQCGEQFGRSDCSVVKTRAVEMYIGVGTDNGTWDTDYVDIPIDTPEDKIAEVAKDAVRASGTPFVICGVYSIPSLDDQPDAEDEEIDASDGVETRFGNISINHAMIDTDGTNLADGVEIRLDGKLVTEVIGGSYCFDSLADLEDFVERNTDL